MCACVCVRACVWSHQHCVLYCFRRYWLPWTSRWASRATDSHADYSLWYSVVYFDLWPQGPGGMQALTVQKDKKEIKVQRACQVKLHESTVWFVNQTFYFYLKCLIRWSWTGWATRPQGSWRATWAQRWARTLRDWTERWQSLQWNFLLLVNSS